MLPVVAVVAVALLLFHHHRLFVRPNVSVPADKVALYVPSDKCGVAEVVDALSQKAEIRDRKALEKVFKKMNCKAVRPGHYVIRDGMGNKELVDMLRRGLQTPVRVTFHNLRTKQELAASLSRQLMPDSVSIVAALSDSAFLAPYGMEVETALVMFLPNTYEFFWNVDVSGLFDRMKREYDRFWTDERRAKASSIPLSCAEVSVLASIVEEETNLLSEYATVAGLYINRLKRGMLLQADPTVKYAVGDFTLRRVLKKHLETDSPYNTYIYKGLPPGPIRIPSAAAIDAVLNYEKHNYLYMAAKETLNGEHHFATNLRDHTNNARRYQRALNRLKVYR